jgi:hypothetical protein
MKIGLIMSKTVLVLLIVNVASWAQSSSLKLVNAKQVFTPVAIKDAEDKLKIFNQSGNTKVTIFISFFYLPTIEMRVDYDESKLSSEYKQKMGDLIKVSIEPKAFEKNNQLFSDLSLKSDNKARDFFNKLENKENYLIVNINLGKSYAHQRKKESEETHPYYSYSLLAGESINPELIADLKAVLDMFKKRADKFNFDKYDKNNTNDKNLNALMLGLFTPNSMPFLLTWVNSEEGKYGWDQNIQAHTKAYPSFQTEPHAGIPWKCIPANGIFVPLPVELNVGDSPDKIVFKLTNEKDFKLKSEKLDENRILWISSTAQNKETAIVPTINGKNIDIYRANVVAYAKVVKTVSVIMVEEENDDIQLVKPGTKGLNPDTPIIEAGPNGFLDTRVPNEVERKTYSNDDEMVCDENNRCVMTAGPNGICDTNANNDNQRPAEVGFDPFEFEKLLNDIYSPYFIEWKVEKNVVRKAVNYDLDRSTYYDMDVFTLQNNQTVRVNLQEEETIYKNARTGSADHYLFFITRVRTFNVEVLARETEFASATVHIDNIQNYAELNKMEIKKILYKTCAHELGHAALKLAHSSLTDDTNLMHPHSDNGIILRKFQWDIAHGLMDPKEQFKFLN